MRTIRVLLIAILSIAGISVFLTPASAASYYLVVYRDTNDAAFWYPAENILEVCDSSDANGTATATLDVIDGGA